MSDGAPAPPPPPPPPPPPGWKPNWREERSKDGSGSEYQSKPTSTTSASSPLSIPIGNGKVASAAPQSPATASGTGPDGSFSQYDRLPEKLQRTLSKDKKPFTYTPAGIDLSEIKSPKFQKKVSRAKQQGEFSPVCGPGSPGLNEYGQQPPLWPDDIQDISEYCNNPSELHESMTNPRYTGSKIPSRSFKVLQAITATSDDDHVSSPEPPAQQKQPISPRPVAPPFPPAYATPSSTATPSFYASTPLSFNSSHAPSNPVPPPPPPKAPSSVPFGPSSTSFASVPPPVPPPPSGYASASPLYSQHVPTYKKVPPPVPPKPPRGVARSDGISMNSLGAALPSTPLGGLSGPPLSPPLPAFAPPPQPSSFAPPPPPSRPPLPTSFAGSEPLQQRLPYSEQFYQSTVNPVFKTYTPPPSVRQTVRSGPGFKETTTHKSGPGFEETTTYSSYSTPSYSDGTRTLPLRREIKSQTSKSSSFKSQPYYESPYQSVLDTPQFQDPFKFGGMTPTYSNPYTDQLRQDPLSAPIRNAEPFFGNSATMSSNQPTTTATSYRQQTTTRQSTTGDRPLSMTSRFFDEINQMFDQTSANISREMYGTDF